MRYLVRVLALVLCSVAFLPEGPASAADKAGKPSERFRHLKLFADLLSEIERSYVDPKDDELVLEAARGMLRSLDPHSTLLSPEDYALLEQDIEGRFGGVGLEVGVKGGFLTVIAPMPGAPAERAGLRTGDRIIAIDGKSAQNMSIDDTVRTMRGTPGTKVALTIVRKDGDKPIEVQLVREIIKVESVVAELLAPGIVHVALRTFQSGSAAEIRDDIEKLTPIGELRGMVLDLRGNPGGPLEEAVAVADLFLTTGVIVTTRGRGGKVLDEMSARLVDGGYDGPVVVLIDGGSASAAEIVAGALKDHGRALVVGTRSFGKGSVQAILDMGRGFGLKLTIARYYTPSGRSIQAEGIAPDIAVESKKPPAPDDEAALLASLPGERDLPGHLDSGSKKGPDDPAAKIDDYQLRIAFQLVRGLSGYGSKRERGQL